MVRKCPQKNLIKLLDFSVSVGRGTVVHLVERNILVENVGIYQRIDLGVKGLNVDLNEVLST